MTSSPFHAEPPAHRFHQHRAGQVLTDHLNLHGEGVACGDTEVLVSELKFKWSGFNEFGAVLHDASGGFGHPSGP